MANRERPALSKDSDPNHAASSGRDARAFLAGGGEMGERTREFDWSSSPLGPVAGWPRSLRTSVKIMLDSRYAMWLGWGPEFTFFYNDAYAAMTLGPKHPWALGRSAREVWSEIWGDIGPRAESVIRTGRATWDKGLLLFLQRRGFPEETYHTFSYSPIPDDAGGVGGMLCVVTEDTERTIGERRLRTLRELAARTTEEAKSVEDACQSAARTLAEDPLDLPFVLIYLLDAESRVARLAGVAGLAEGSPTAPPRVDLDEPGGTQDDWPLRFVLESGRAEVVSGLGRRFGPLPSAPWHEPPDQAVVVPMAGRGQARPAGFLVAGVSPRLVLDDGYKGFLDLLAGQVATAVTNARAYEEERRRAEALAELDRAKTAFFSIVSHEFRTPLTLMLGPVEDLLSRSFIELSPAAKGQLEVVNRNGLRLLRLVNTLLDFSRIEAGRVRAVFEPTDLAACTADLASVFRAAIERAGLRLMVDCPPMSELVFVDRDMWEKVVLNQLSNAFKFTFEGEIAVSMRRVEGAAELTVRDTGTGIPAKEMPRLFERFHRVQNVRGRTHEGSGIGLALVQELVKLHGGSITAGSRVGEGTTFTITLPLGSAHLPPSQIGEGRSPASTGIGAAPYVEEALRWLPDENDGPPDSSCELPDYRELLPVPAVPPGPGPQDDRPVVLVADDNADMRQYVARLLAERYRVLPVADGEAAVAAARERPPDLVLTDVMMPRLDGFGLLRELRSDPRTGEVPVLMLSARAGEESRVEGMEAGADDYLVKPFGARELLARVSAHLQMARLRREANERTTADLRAMTRLQEVGNSCSRADCDLQDCLEGFLDAAIELTGADKGNIQLFAESSGALEIAAHRGFDRAFLDFFAAVSKKHGAACGAAMQAVARVIVEDVTRSDVFAGTDALGVLLSSGVCAVQSTPLVSSAGHVLGMISTHFARPHQPGQRELRFLDLLARQAADFLERRQAEEAMRRTTEQLRIVTDSMEAPVTRCSRDLKYLWVSKPYADWLRRPADEIVGQPILEIIGPEAFERLYPYFQEVLSGKVVRYEEQIHFRGIGPRWISVAYTPTLGADGVPDGWVAVVNDLTERRRMEGELQHRTEELQTLLDTIPIPVNFAHDPECRSVTGNPAAHEMLRVPAGLNLSITAPAGEQPTHFRVCRGGAEISAKQLPLQRAAQGEQVRNEELEVVFEGGTVSNVLMSAAPLRDKEGRLRGAVASALDITERKQAEEALREADRKKDEFLATLAHELRNPLAPILNAVQLLKANGPSDEMLNFGRDVIQRQVDQMARLLDDLLDVSRITRNKIELRKGRVTLAGVVESAVETSRPLIDAAGHELSIALPADPVCLDADPMRLAQVFANLLNNSAKYTERGGRIALTARRVGGDAVVTIEDNGIGIPPEAMPSLFEMFSQAAPAIERSQGGLGIGLSLVKGLVELHGGTVQAFSDGPGKGSRFVVRLPAAAPPALRAPKSPQTSRRRSGGRRIVVADDNADAVDSLAKLLAFLGHETRTARDGQEAIEVAEAFRPEVALLDIGMPRLNGYAAARRIRRQPWGRDMMLVALTGWGQEDDRRRSREAGFDAHLVKPVDPEALEALLASRTSAKAD
jgi:PAS domain S-box-containing protein